ncbi:MAG: hypothetical protein J1G38_03430 [Clostridiales bacterium]|nr:hypothetical protein [Clostridiales bacterium]
MSKGKTILYYIIIFVLSAAVAIGVWTIGLVYAEEGDGWNIAFGVSLGATALLSVLNIVCNFVISRKFGRMRFQELFDYAEDMRKKAQSDIEGVRKKTVCHVVLAYVYLAAIFVLICLCAFAMGKAKLGVDVTTTFMLIFIYFLASVFDILFFPIGKELNQSEIELSKGDFPLMHETTERAARAVGFNGKIRIFLVENNITVNVYRGAAYITIGYKEAALFTSKELYAVMLHEFSHIVHADVNHAKRINRIERLWDPDNTDAALTFLPRLAFLSLIANFLSYNIEIYKTFSSIINEQAADETVRRLDCNGSFADALAKTEMIAKYVKCPVPELDYYFFESETLRNDFATTDYKTYFEYYKKYGEIWRYEFEHELPSKVSTHPTSKMRIQSFGLDLQSCVENATDPDPMYVVEQQRVLEHADAYIYKHSAEHYAEQREQVYIERKAAIESLDSSEEKGEDFKGAAREKALWAILGVDDDRAMALADRMIEDNDRAHAAYFVKGFVYSRLHDDSCVECLKKAAEKPEYAEQAYTLIGQYALMTGNEQLLEEYRSDIADVMQTAQDKMIENEFKKSSPTEPCDLDISVIAELADKINETVKNAVKKLYVSKFTAPDGSVHYPFAFELTFKAAARNNNNDFAISYAIFEVIEARNDEPSFILCNPRVGLARKVKRAEGVLVYDCVKKIKVEK